MDPIFVNLRCMQRRMTGVQRYTHEVTSRLNIPWKGLSPARPLGHIAGPLWDQSVLQRRAQSGLLWSPANTGPVFHHKHVITIHDLAVLKKEPWFSPGFQWYYSHLIPQLIKNSIHIITDSQFIRSEILSLSPTLEKKVTVCPLGVGQEFYLEPTPDLARPYLLAVGSLDPRKNLPRLFNAWEVVHKRYPEFELRVVGGGNAVFKEMNLSRAHMFRIKILQGLTDSKLIEQYQSATAFVYPSLYEGFGLPVLEAMASGLPVITSENSAMSEIAGNSALFVDPKSEKSIVDAIIRLIESKELRLTLSRSGKAISQAFTWERTAREISTILSKHI